MIFWQENDVKASQFSPVNAVIVCKNVLQDDNQISYKNFLFS